MSATYFPVHSVNHGYPTVDPLKLLNVNTLRTGCTVNHGYPTVDPLKHQDRVLKMALLME